MFRFGSVLVGASMIAGLLLGAPQRTNVQGSTTPSARLDNMSSPQLPSGLWPKFSTPKRLIVVNVEKLSSTDLLTATTLEGIYNGEQLRSRLYLVQTPQDQFWLTHAVPRSIRTKTLTGPNHTGTLQMLLRRFRGSVRGVIVTNPSNPNTIDLATTMAGIDHAVVMSPSQLGLAKQLGLRVMYSFDTPSFTQDSAAQTYQWGVQNLLAKSSTRDLVMLNPAISGDIRDYAVATKSFVFYLTSTSSDQQPVMNAIIQHTPPNTPILGYIPNEGPDVADLSSLGHFLNASDFLTNESVWAAMASPPSLHQGTQPQAIQAKPNTVYVAFLVSDGDNAQYVQNRMEQVWQGANLGSVPEGWTIPPGMIDFAPTLLDYYYRHLPSNSELDAGPSGIGYATEMSGSNLTRFAQLSSQFMARDNIHTVDNWEALSNLSSYAQASGAPSISVNSPMPYEKIGSSVAFGQTSTYIASAQQLFCTVKQQSASRAAGAPLFLEPLVDAWALDPTDVLHVAQQLARAGRAAGQHYVFTTPSELALTMERYYEGKEAGLPTSSPQSMTGSETLQKPIVSPPFSSAPVQITGPNLITNPSGQQGTAGWYPAYGGQDATVSSTMFDGSPTLRWTVGNIGHQDWVSYYPAVKDGNTYTFSVQVAGSGQVFMDVWTGQTDITTLPVQLSSSFQTLTWTVTIPSNAPTGQSGQAPQLQLRESGAGPVSVYYRNATVAPSTPSC